MTAKQLLACEAELSKIEKALVDATAYFAVRPYDRTGKQPRYLPAVIDRFTDKWGSKLEAEVDEREEFIAPLVLRIGKLQQGIKKLDRKVQAEIKHDRKRVEKNRLAEIEHEQWCQRQIFQRK